MTNGSDRKKSGERDLEEILRDAARRLLRAVIEHEVDEQIKRLEVQKEEERESSEAPEAPVSEELLKERNLESLGILADGLAHDFNNLLMTILGNISLAKNRLTPGERSFGRLVEAEKACMAGKDLIHRLMTFSKSGRASIKPLSMASLLREWTTPYAGPRVHVNLLLADDLAPVEADEEQISQVVAELVTNACEAMPKGGTITVRAGTIALTGDEGLPLAPGRYVRLSIEDTGIGIQEEHLSRIFDPYFPTKERGASRGSGLGLAIAYAIVKRHGGHIAVESATGVGTTFHIYLPVSTTEPLEAPATKARGAARILVVDDEDVVRETIVEMLTLIGYEVSSAKTGQEAVNAFREAQASGIPFSAVMLDLVMEDGMGGEETLQRLKAIDPGVKAIASSGYSGFATVSEWAEYGFSAAISKPYKIDELREKLDKLLKENPEN